jgi:RimJ/RimL family protein N-acetyltransferase
VIEVRLAPAEHYGWIAERARLAIGSEFRAFEALDGGVIVGMVGYDGWTHNSCSMHVAIEKPIAIRRLLRPAFGLVFDPRPKGCGFGLVKGHVLSSNSRALALDLGLGFRELGRVKDGWDVGVDEIMLVMRREDCRWLEG